MNVEQLLQQIKNEPESVEFREVLLTITENYDYQPVKFFNGAVVNEAGDNEASCKIFSFCKLHGLDKKQTLSCFGKFYRDDVLANPAGVDHENIRSFMACGWDALEFEGEALKPK
jgi:hypothetical protein